jgi:hypothetical protein
MKDSLCSRNKIRYKLKIENLDLSFGQFGSVLMYRRNIKLNGARHRGRVYLLLGVDISIK